MLVKKLIELKNIYKGKKAIVCGCGRSLNDFYNSEYFKKVNESNIVTIGVNDVPKLFDPTHLVITDHVTRFNKGRIDLINNCKSKSVITCVKGWNHPRLVHFELGKRGRLELDDYERVDHHLNSPYTAVNIAYKLGASKIGMIGVDFTDGHFYSPKDGPHNLTRKYLSSINSSYEKLHRQLGNRGVDFYNLSLTSKVTTVPYLDFKNFIEI